MHRNRKPCNSFLVVNLARSIDRGRVQRSDVNDVAQHADILQIIPSLGLQAVLKPANANKPRIQVNRRVNFSCIKMYFTAYVLYSLS